jgi:hypothetical protein
MALAAKSSMAHMGKLSEFFSENGRAVRLWNSTKVGVPLWIISAGLLFLWLFKAPPPGYAVGALAVVAGVMSVRDIKVLGKILWVFLLVCFLITEFRAIDKDRADNQEAQKKFFESQKEGFAGISQQAAQQFSATTQGLTAAVNGLNGVLQTTQGVADLARKNLENVTGGTSFAYVVPNTEIVPAAPDLWKHGFSMTVINEGRDTLILNIVVAHVLEQTNGHVVTDLGPMTPTGPITLAAHTAQQVPERFIQVNADSTHVDHFLILINAQNGSEQEDMWFRPAKSGIGWACKFVVQKPLVPGSLKSVKIIKQQDWKEPVVLP